GVDDVDERAQAFVLVRLDPADGSRRVAHQAGDDAAARSARGSAISSATTARPSGAIVAGTPRITWFAPAARNARAVSSAACREFDVAPHESGAANLKAAGSRPAASSAREISSRLAAK